MGRELVRAWLVAWLVFAVPHLVLHAANIHHPLVIDRAGNLSSLGSVVVPLIPLYLDGSSRKADRPRTEGAQSG